MKRKILIFAVALALLAAGTGIGILAAESGYGSQSDPLITLSYVNSILKPELESKTAETLEKTADEFSSKLAEKVAAYEASVRGMLGSGSALPTTDVFGLVTLEYGDTLICARGAELMLRIGTADAWGDDSPALVDTTSGDTLDDGEALTSNHMYMVTISDCGLTATDDTVKLLVRGSYTIS
jgi:hypothetical protein